ncbi:MAG: ATP-dependent Clp protease proteolytic subunit [Acidobacteriaceae bacterium]
MTTPPAIQLPLGQVVRPPAFISFTAEVVPQTAESLLNAVTGLVNQGFRDIHLLVSTPGGIVALGITIYNVLRGLPIDLTTHNVGNVDSIGTVIYLAGEHRFTCPQATFMLHGVSFTSPVPAQFFEKTLKERLASIQADHERIKAIYNERAGIDPQRAEEIFLGENTMNATESVESGIAHGIRLVQIPAGSPVLQLIFNRQGTMQVI